MKPSCRHGVQHNYKGSFCLCLFRHLISDLSYEAVLVWVPWKPVLTLDLLLHIVLLLLNSCKSVSGHSESGPLILSHITKIIKVNLAFRDIKTSQWLLPAMRTRLHLALPQTSVPGPQENVGVKKSFLYCNYSISQYLFFPSILLFLTGSLTFILPCTNDS